MSVQAENRKKTKRTRDPNQLAAFIVAEATSEGDDAEDKDEGDGKNPAACSGIREDVVTKDPDHVSTSYVERQNLTMRMCMRRFTRLTNGFSKKVENHERAISRHFWFYNMSRIHKTLRVTPAMEAGVTDRVLDLGDLADLIDENAN